MTGIYLLGAQTFNPAGSPTAQMGDWKAFRRVPDLANMSLPVGFDDVYARAARRILVDAPEIPVRQVWTDLDSDVVTP